MLLEFIPLHHVILLKALLSYYELNTLYVGRSWSMCWVIVVDAGRSRSTCHIPDAYIHDHCLRCLHNYALLYQLLNSNLFTHRMFSSREKPLVKPMPPGSIFHHIIFLSICYFCRRLFCNLYFPIYTTKIPKYLSYYLYQISLLQVVVKGLTTPLSRWLQGSWLFVQVRGTYV